MIEAEGGVLSSLTSALARAALFNAASMQAPPFDTEVPAKGVSADTEPELKVLVKMPD